MRLLKIGVYYPTYLEQFYARLPGLAAQPYAAQHAALIEDCFGSSDFWTKALEARLRDLRSGRQRRADAEGLGRGTRARIRRRRLAL